MRASSVLVSCMDSPHAAVGVTTLPSVPFHLQPSLSQLMHNAAAAPSPTPGTPPARWKLTTLPKR